MQAAATGRGDCADRLRPSRKPRRARAAARLSHGPKVRPMLELEANAASAVQIAARLRGYADGAGVRSLSSHAGARPTRRSRHRTCSSLRVCESATSSAQPLARETPLLIARRGGRALRLASVHLDTLDGRVYGRFHAVADSPTCSMRSSPTGWPPCGVRLAWGLGPHREFGSDERRVSDR